MIGMCGVKIATTYIANRYASLEDCTLVKCMCRVKIIYKFFFSLAYIREFVVDCREQYDIDNTSNISQLV